MSNSTHDQRLITARYRIHDQIGAGAMGEVYRAYDRLSGKDVALKRVLLSPGLTAAEIESEMLMLANEFQLLAGLRHPHIISVLDYGFDAQRRPFYTMDLLSGAQTILEAGAALPIVERVSLLIQALEALAYLHRRGVLHQDLKPANMMVVDGHLRLLDFGLAILASNQSDEVSGSLPYMAPEVTQRHPYSQAADLYALGVIAYELLAGRHPFPADTVHEFLQLVRHTAPDLTPLASWPDLAGVIGRLLDKQPARRPASAHATALELSKAAGLAVGAISPAIRESYLQAATFVGREAELARLSAALEQARQGRGSAWLIGGESGVGKSRLLDELRTRALVSGFQVLRGYAAEGGGMPYQLWREPLRQLVLAAEVSDLEAAVLKELVPDIAALLGRPAAVAPALYGVAAQQRLVLAIADLVTRLAQPTLLILEDLHWSKESLLPLEPLCRRVGPHPLIIVGSYRDDEAPGLPQRLPGMDTLPLPRLNEAEIADLSRSILGESSVDGPLIEFLQRETEGNSFFLVEVVRVLAEEAGDLDRVGSQHLPRYVQAGGVEHVVRRRLARVPAWAKAALDLAAVISRQIDLRAIQVGVPTLDLGGWLRTCADAAVLEVAQDRWQFAHNKLRERLLLDLAEGQRRALHRQAITAIEQAHAADLPDYYNNLAAFAAVAQDRDSERRYSYLAGVQAAAQYRNEQALPLLARALDLTDPANQVARYDVLCERERVNLTLGRREQQHDDLQALVALADALADDKRQAYVLVRRAIQAEAVGAYQQALGLAHQAVEQAERLGDATLTSEAHLVWGMASTHLSNYPLAEEQLALTQQIALANGLPDLAARALNALALVCLHQSKVDQVKDYLGRAHRLTEQIGNRSSQVDNLIYQIWAARQQVELARGEACAGQALQLARSIGALPTEARVLINFGFLLIDGYGDIDRAMAVYQEALQLARRSDRRGYEAILLANMGGAMLLSGDLAAAQAWCEEALALSEAIDELRTKGIALRALGLIAIHQGQLDAAEGYYAEAFDILQAVGNPGSLVEAYAGYARLLLVRDDLPGAVQAVEQVLAFLPLGDLSEGYPAQIIWSCYEVLKAAGDPRVLAVLEQAQIYLQRRADAIDDPARRRLLFERIPLHRALMAAWRYVQAGIAGGPADSPQPISSQFGPTSTSTPSGTAS